MKITKIISIILLTLTLLFLSGWYICKKIILPKFLSSNTTKSKIERLVYKKTKLRLSIDNINYQNGHLKILGKLHSENKIAIFKEITSDIYADLYIHNSKFAGKLIAKNLNAKMTPALIENTPVHFDETIFYYNGQNITTKGCGTLGEERACHILKINNAFKQNQEIFGRVKSNITPHSVKYVKNFNVINDVGIKINYSVQNKIIDVKYLLDIQKDADIFYKKAYLGSRNNARKLYIHTNKDGDIFDIQKYAYSILEEKKYKTILTGEGKFVKINEHFRPKHLSAKTNSYVPSSITNYFNNCISGGEFAGDLHYDFEDKKLIGNFTIKDFTHKDFYVKNAEIIADKSFIDINATGKYLKETFDCKIHGKNNFGKSGKSVYIYDMDLMLNKYIFKKHKYTNKRRFIPDIDLTIENWNILVKSIVKNRIVLRNVKLQGALVDNIFKFKTSKTAFAKGTLSANGKYNFNNKISEVDFYADNIDSNQAADLIFNLPEQVKGTANARLRIKAYGKLENFQARAAFNIREGHLPKLGDKEFLFKKGKKRFKISNILRIKKKDKKDEQIYSANIKGSFYMDNYLLKNIILTSQQKYLSFLLEGNFDLKNDIADLKMFGKYNADAQKGIKVLFVPIKFIVKFLFKPENTYKNYAQKLDKVPSIEANKEETKYFRVKFSGNLKENKTKIETKSIIN